MFDLTVMSRWLRAPDRTWARASPGPWQPGAALVVNDFHADRALRVAEEINQAGGQAVAIPFDVTDLAAVIAGFDEATARLGQVDVLVNNAGTGGPTEPMHVAQFAEMAPDKWAPIIAVNLFGPMNCAKAAIGLMIDRQWGRVRTISSGAARSAWTSACPIRRRKAGASGFMRHLGIQNAKHGVTVNTFRLDSSWTTPGWFRRWPRLSRRAGWAHARCRRTGGLLASDEASWPTGQTIGLNGGALTS